MPAKQQLHVTLAIICMNIPAITVAMMLQNV
jgi:hypothetical protein